MESYRILVVEDKPDLCSMYANEIREYGCLADEALSKDDALFKILDKTYHVVVVDLDLVGEDSREHKVNLDGIVVLQEISRLNEGTKGFVLSGQAKPQVSADATLLYGASGYLDKDVLILEGIESLPPKILPIAEQVNLKLWGDEKDPIFFFGGKSGNDREIWIHNCSTNFNLHGDVELFNSFLKKLTADFAPLVPKKSLDLELLPFNSEQKMIKGEFWSKAIGCPVNVSITTKNSPQIGFLNKIEGDTDYLTEVKAGDLVGVVTKNTKRDRDFFKETL